MSSGLSSRGHDWEAGIESQYNAGQAPGFYIEIINEQDTTNRDKLAVTFDDVKGMWKVDTTAVQVAEGATGAITAASTAVTTWKFHGTISHKWCGSCACCS